MRIDKKNLKIQALIVLTFLFFTVYKTEAAITYTWIGTTSTAWNVSTNWSSSGGTYPQTNTDIVIINYSALHQPTVVFPSSPNYFSIGSLTIDSGATLTYNTYNNLYIYNNMTLNSYSSFIYSSSGLEVDGDLTINSNATFSLASSGSISIYGNLYGTGTLSAGASSTVGFGPGFTHSISAFSFYNLQIYDVATLTGDIVVTGSITGTGTLTPGSHNISVGTGISITTLTTGTGSSTVTTTAASCIIGAAYTFNNLTINNSTNLSADIIINGNLAGSSTFKPYTHAAPGSGHNFSVGGNMTVGTLNVGTGSCTCTLTGASQTINGGYTFDNLVVNSSTGASFSGDVIASGNLSGTGTLVGGSNNITVGGTFSVSNFTANTSTVILSGTSNLGAYTFNNLTINGTATLTGDLIVSSNLAGSGTLTPATYNVTVGGNTTINTITVGTGTSTTTLSGASQGINAQTFNNLTLSCSTKATLSGNVTVNGTLKFTSGVLDIGSYKLTIGTSGSITGFSSSSYIYTSGSGTLEMTVTTAGATFYIGDDYNPITITPTSGTAIYDIAVSNGVTDASNAALTSNAVGATWTITVLSGSQTVTVIPQWNGSQELSGFHGSPCFVAYRKSLTSAWIPTSVAKSAVLVGGMYTQTSDTFTIAAGHTYYIGVGDNLSPLPVTLISFNAALENNHVDLNWTTASEINNNYFGMERSLDGLAWQSIGQVPGHGNSQVKENYSFTDNLLGVVPSLDIYYRLKQVDYNGKYAYSEIRSVSPGANSISLQTYPNPAGNVLNLNWDNKDNGNVILNLINISGTTVYTENISGAGLKSSQINLSGFPSGTYILQIVNDKDVISRMVYKK